MRCNFTERLPFVISKPVSVSKLENRVDMQAAGLAFEHFDDHRLDLAGALVLGPAHHRQEGLAAPGPAVACRRQEFDGRAPQVEAGGGVLGGEAGDDDLHPRQQTARLVARLARREREKFRVLFETRAHSALPPLSCPDAGANGTYSKHSRPRQNFSEKPGKFTNENFTFHSP